MHLAENYPPIINCGSVVAVGADMAVRWRGFLPSLHRINVSMAKELLVVLRYYETTNERSRRSSMHFLTIISQGVKGGQVKGGLDYFNAQLPSNLKDALGF